MLFLVAEQPLVERGGLLRRAVDEHLDLVELVHAEHAPGVLARGARLAPEAGGHRHVSRGKLVGLQALVHVDARHRDLGGSRQVQVVALKAVEVHLVGRQETRTVHGPLAREHRRQYRKKTPAERGNRARSGRARVRSAPRCRTGRRTATRTAARRVPCPPSRTACASSRWSRGVKPNLGGSPQVRSTTASSSAMPSAAVGSGRFGIRSSRDCRSCPALASSDSAAASSSLSPRSSASSSALGAPFEERFCTARSRSAFSVNSRQRLSAASSASKSAAAPLRASAVRKRSGSFLAALRSITWRV